MADKLIMVLAPYTIALTMPASPSYFAIMSFFFHIRIYIYGATQHGTEEKIIHCTMSVLSTFSDTGAAPKPR